MALIVCPYCGKEVSDKAKTCPGCGTQLVEEKNEDSRKICPDCGAEIADDVEACQNCGCPIVLSEEISENETSSDESLVSSDAQNNKKLSRKNKAIIVSVVVIALLSIILGVVINSITQSQERKNYFENLELASSMMITGAAEAESAGNLIKAVWYNTIYEEYDAETDKYTLNGYRFNDDFNDSLYALFADSDFQSEIDSIKNNQSAVALLMKELKNPPEEYQEAYESIRELYDAYLELTELATNPTGSLTTYSSNFNDADSNTVKCYKAMKIYLEE